jgi:hypothetical protein
MVTFSIVPCVTVIVAPLPGLTFLLWSAGVMVSWAVETGGRSGWAAGAAAVPEHAATASATAPSKAAVMGR